jgi:hypothetical protein
MSVSEGYKNVCKFSVRARVLARLVPLSRLDRPRM